MCHLSGEMPLSFSLEKGSLGGSSVWISVWLSVERRAWLPHLLDLTHCNVCPAQRELQDQEDSFFSPRISETRSGARSSDQELQGKADRGKSIQS